MRKDKAQLEWQIGETCADGDDALWPPPMDMASAAPSTQHHPERLYLSERGYLSGRGYLWGGLLALLLLLAIGGGWLWYTAERGVAQIDQELGDIVKSEIASPAPTLTAREKSAGLVTFVWQSQLEREEAILQTMLQKTVDSENRKTPLTPPSNAAIGIKVRETNLQGDLAVVNFVTQATDERKAYRQTRFYRYSARGWLRTQPIAELWGTPRTLESPHFAFRFRQNDAEVVAAVSPQIESLYAELQRNFGLAPGAEKLVIEVTVERATGVVLMDEWPHRAVVVPSPAVYLAPVEMDDATILAQSIALPLIDYMVARVMNEAAIPLHWQHLRAGLALWQLWDLEMPLAQWRQEVVQWFDSDLPMGDPERQAGMAERYAELCAMHSMWMLKPAMMGIPLQCVDWEERLQASNQWIAYVRHVRMGESGLPQSGYYQDGYSGSDDFASTKAVNVATLFEYTVATYGYERLPDLLAGMAHYDEWESLLPAVYNVTSSEFEKGWRAFLIQNYGP